MYDPRDHRKMFRINICGTLPDAGCGPNAGASVAVVSFISAGLNHTNVHHQTCMSIFKPSHTQINWSHSCF